MTVSKPLRFVLQLITLMLFFFGAVQLADRQALSGLVLIAIGAGLWWLSRRPTAS